MDGTIETPDEPKAPPRRPLATRSKGWAQALARRLTAAGVAPNHISLTGLGFALVAGALLAASGGAQGAARSALLVGAGIAIQMRLLCNMLDGMVAIEGGRRTPTGEIYNDAPDRFADLAILVGAGYGCDAFAWGTALGWSAAVLAVLTAYIRLLGASMGTKHYFIGPMAKPHRMATITVACALSAFEPLAGLHGQTLALGLALVVAGSAVTIVRRLRRIAADLEAR